MSLGISKRSVGIAFAVAVTLSLLPGYFVLCRGGRARQLLDLEHKTVRETTATVMGKEHVQFDEANHSYMHEDGYQVQRKAGEEEWRIYYRIDNFDQIEEPVRSRLLEAERERDSTGRLRFRIVAEDHYR